MVKRRSAWSRALPIGVVAIVATAAAFIFLPQHRAADAADVSKQEDEEKENPARPSEWMWAQRANADGSIPATAYRDAIEQARQIERDTISTSQVAGVQVAGVKWELVGPSNIAGRLIDLVIDPNTPGTVYVAAATGGVWKSADGGVTLTSVWPDDETQSMGALAIDPSGILYAGTGEPDNGGGGAFFGTGVFRSTDGGRNWLNLGLEDSGSIGRIRIDPLNPQRIFVAVQGRLFDTSGQRGLFLSDNGGETWRQVLDGLNNTTGAIDVAINPANPDIVLAAMWDKLRFPDGREFGGPGSGLFRSTDGGETWQRVGAPLPGSASEPGRIGVAFADSDPGRAYAITNDHIGNLTGFFVSDDAGATWTRPLSGEATLDAADGGFAWWFGRLWVDPNDAEHVFSAGVQLVESRDGGATWTAGLGSPSVHVDQHALAWSPHGVDRVYLGNDGGLYRSDQNGDVSGSWTGATIQPFSQFYAIDVSAQDATRVSGGTQDNGSIRSWGGTDWNRYLGGDGMINRINPVDLNNVYACFQFGGCVRSDDGGDTTTFIGGLFAGSRFNWVSPLEIASGRPDTVYFGSNLLNRSDDRGRTWRAVSPDLSGGPTPRGAADSAPSPPSA